MASAPKTALTSLLGKAHLIAFQFTNTLPRTERKCASRVWQSPPAPLQNNRLRNVGQADGALGAQWPLSIRLSSNNVIWRIKDD